MYEFVIPTLAFVSTTAIGAAVLTAQAARRQQIRERLHRRDLSGYDPGGEGDGGGFVRFVQRFGSAVEPGGHSSKLHKALAMAGYHGRSAGSVYIGAKLLLFLIGLVGLSTAVAGLEASLTVKALAVLAGLAVLFYLPNLVVYAAKQRRQTEVRNHLPDAIDLLEICVSSGMGIDMAWNAVADEVRRVSNTLGDEMVLTNLEIHLGSPRAAAMRNMAHRTGSDELGSLVSALIQTERFGTSISDTLKTFATSMREKRRLRAEETAEKLAVKLLFPMVLFIFPAVFIVTAGPAGIRIATMISLG